MNKKTTENELRVSRALTEVEEAMKSKSSGKILLLLERDCLNNLALALGRHLLSSDSSHRILLLAPPASNATLIETWNQQLSGRYTIAGDPRNAEAQVCITSLLAIQMQVGADANLPFYKAFDAVIVYVPTNPGPVWHQVVNIFAIQGFPVLGLNATLSREEGELFFEKVIDAKIAVGDELKPV